MIVHIIFYMINLDILAMELSAFSIHFGRIRTFFNGIAEHCLEAGLLQLNHCLPWGLRCAGEGVKPHPWPQMPADPTQPQL